MEGYANVNSNHEDYDDLNIEGRNSSSDDWKKKEELKLVSQQHQQAVTASAAATREQESRRDLERRVLSLQVPLDDGSGQGYVFSFKLAAGAQRWRCHLCDVLVIGSRHVDTHIQSKKHQVKLALPSHPRSLFTRFEPRDRVAVEVPALAPGEPVPPGFEDVVRRVAQIQATLDAHRSSPLIGLEYMVELTPEERGKEPMYVCMLCDKKGDPRVAMAHMTSFNHRSKYIGIHFPTASKLIATEFQSRKDNKKLIHIALNHLCLKIEDRFGRLKPLVVEKDVFERQRDQIKTQIDQEKHFSESPGDTLVELLDQKIIDALVEEEEKKEAEPQKPDPPPPTVFNRGKISCDRSRIRGRSEEDTALDEENVFKKLAEMEKRATEALKEKEKGKMNTEPKKTEDASKKEVPDRGKSLSSISSISSSSLSLSRSKSPGSRGGSRSPPPHGRGVRRPPSFGASHRGGAGRGHDRDRDRVRDRGVRDRFRGRWVSPPGRGGRGGRRSRSRSRSRPRGGRSRSRSRSPAHRRPRRRSSRSRSRSRSPRRRSSASPSAPFRKRGPRPAGSASPPATGRGGASSGNGSPTGRNSAGGDRRARENERQRWQKFREEADRIDRDMIDKLKFHEKNPEKHPMYPEEWKKFWNRRYKELQAEGRDPAKHDFKPEWIEYWNRRMREMYDEELKSKKDEWRVRLGLPEEGEEPPRAPVRKRRADRAPSAGGGDGDRTDDVIVLSPPPGSKEEKQARKDVTVADIKNTWKALTGSDIKDSERRSPSPWEDTMDVPPRRSTGGGGNEDVSPNRGDGGSGGKWWSRGGGAQRGSGSIQRAVGSNRLGGTRASIYEPKGGPGGVVNALRMLTALENQLGSLGPQVNTLLSKALALEKIASNSSEQLLADPVHLALLETAREKLKGQLYAGIVERNMVMATRSSIQSVGNLLLKADKIRPSPQAVAAAVARSTAAMAPGVPVPAALAVAVGSTSAAPPPLASPAAATLLSVITSATPSAAQSAASTPSEPVVVPGIGTMDKVAIAQQIAEALVLQGKTDVSQEELETLINAVVGMAQASAGSHEPISAAAYARQQQLQQPQIQPPAASLTLVPGRAPSAGSVHAPLSVDTTLASTESATKAGGQSPFTQLLSSVSKQSGVTSGVGAGKRPTALQILQSAYNESSRNDGTSTGAKAFSGRAEKMDDLSEEDLKTLLQNFKELPSEEQYGLISYLKKVEAKEPARVERLRQFVNVGQLVKSPRKEAILPRKQPNMKADSLFQNKLQELKSLHRSGGSSSTSVDGLNSVNTRGPPHGPAHNQSHLHSSSNNSSDRLSPFSLREAGINPSGDDRSLLKTDSDKVSKLKVDDSDDDDYSFEDIYAAASRKVKEREKAIAEETAKLEKEEKKKGKTPEDPRVLLRETKAIIANLMGQLPAKFIQKQSPIKESPSTPRKVEAPVAAAGGQVTADTGSAPTHGSVPAPGSVPGPGTNYNGPGAKQPLFNLANLQQTAEQTDVGMHQSSMPVDNSQYYPNYMDTNAPTGYGGQYNQYPDQVYQEPPVQQNYQQLGYDQNYSDSGYYSSQHQQQSQQHTQIPGHHNQNFQPQYNQGPYGSGYSDPGIVNTGNQYHQQPYQASAQNYPTGYGQYSGQQGGYY